MRKLICADFPAKDGRPARRDVIEIDVLPEVKDLANAVRAAVRDAGFGPGSPIGWDELSTLLPDEDANAHGFRVVSSRTIDLIVDGNDDLNAGNVLTVKLYRPKGRMAPYALLPRDAALANAGPDPRHYKLEANLDMPVCGDGEALASLPVQPATSWVAVLTVGDAPDRAYYTDPDGWVPTTFGHKAKDGKGRD